MSLFIIGLLAPLATAVAHAEVENGDQVWISAREGYGGTGLFPIFAETPADTQDPGRPDYWAYCIEHAVSAKVRTHGQVGNLSSFLGSNYFDAPQVQGKVLWVLAHSYPALGLSEFGAAVGAPGISRNDAIEATQYAIWRYTDLDWDAPWAWETPDSEKAYWYLVNGANANPGLTPADLTVTASITAPTDAQTADSLVGPFVVSTDRTTVEVTASPAVSLVDAAGDAIDPTVVVDGQEIYLDLRGTTAADSATVTVTAKGTGGTGKVISVPTSDGGTPTAGDHAQSIILVAPSTAQTTAEATVSWTGSAAVQVPVIGTRLVDVADGDHVLAWDGGSVVDTIEYRNLTPGREYTVSGELMRKSDGSGTGITASKTFTPTAAEGSVEVTFVVPEGFAGEKLVAFEELFEGDRAAGDPVAVHQDINDARQTVTIAEETKTPAPVIGTRLVDVADGDHVLAWDGGSVVDTIEYRNLMPGREYTVSGELMRKSDGSGTGITASKTFTPTAAEGSVEVTFVVPEGFAGEKLVAFEELFEGDRAAGDPVAVHQDINDARQTVTVEGEAAAVTDPSPQAGESLPETGAGPQLKMLAFLGLLLAAGGIALVSAGRRAKS